MFDSCYSYSEEALVQCKTRYLWVLDKHCDYSGFDFAWEPAPWESHFRHAFGSQWQKDSGTYLVPKAGYSETKYNKEQTVTKLTNFENWEGQDFNFDYSWHPDPTDPPYVYQFGTQWQKTGGPKYTVPGATSIKYVDSPRINKTVVDAYWTKPAGKFEDFDYTWHPDTTEKPYIYQFGTQHQKTGGPRYTVPGATDTKFVGDITSRVRAVASGAVLVKHLTTEYTVDGVDVVATTRFISNYLDTLKRILRKVTDEYVWVISDLCDYKDFDFSWHPAVWQNSMLHVFPSNEQKFGDTFFVHVESFLETANEIKLLEYYSPLNFVETKLPRVDPPHVQIETDSVVDAIWKHEFVQPVVQFYKHKPVKPVTISLWQERLRTVVPLVAGSESVLVPKDAKNHIRTQVYDYEWIDKKHIPLPAHAQDIVYISYDETDAEKNYQTLLEYTDNLPNQVYRITGVDGMQNALKAASTISTTPWSYQVFAKTELNPEFRFDYTPDYLQVPKHYIFHCHNMSNDLVYGHMGVVMYNNQMVRESLDYRELGLDFTMSFPVEVVPELSCYGRFATSPYQAWRTAFRETSKLSADDNIESRYRLKIWCERATGNHAEWVLRGAQDGVEFYKECNGELQELKRAFDWTFLQQRFNTLYNISNG